MINGIAQNNLETIYHCVQNGVDVNQQDQFGNTPLHWAAYNNQLGTVKYLVQHGARLETPNFTELQTPLHWASIGGHIRIVDFLIQHQTFLHSHTYLHVHQQNSLPSHQQLNIQEMVNKKDTRGYTPLHCAAQNDK